MNWAVSHENFVNMCIFFNMSACQHWCWWCLVLYTQTLCLRLRCVFRLQKDPVSFFKETLIQLPLSRCRQNRLRKKKDDQATAIPYFSKVRGSHIITFSIHSPETVTICSMDSQLHPDVKVDEVLALVTINTHAQYEWAHIRPTHIWFSGVLLGLGSRKCGTPLYPACLFLVYPSCTRVSLLSTALPISLARRSHSRSGP